jgi:hypothetical protein
VIELDPNVVQALTRRPRPVLMRCSSSGGRVEHVNVSCAFRTCAFFASIGYADDGMLIEIALKEPNIDRRAVTVHTHTGRVCAFFTMSNAEGQTIEYRTDHQPEET